MSMNFPRFARYVSNARTSFRISPIETKSVQRPGKGLLLNFVNQMVASAFAVDPAKMRSKSKQTIREIRARQISIYLLHTCLSFSFTEAGKLYGRDRTTAAHACRKVEELRDHSEFNQRLIDLERIIHSVVALMSINTGVEVRKHG